MDESSGMPHELVTGLSGRSNPRRRWTVDRRVVAMMKMIIKEASVFEGREREH